MALKDVIIVTEKQMANKYQKPAFAEKVCTMLRSMDLLPLTVESLTTKRGNALLHFATWIYFSGSISSRQYVPSISGEEKFLEELAENHLKNLGKPFRVYANSLFVREDAGIIGRLINAMGVSKPEEDSLRGRHRKKIAYSHCNGLPHYFYDILSSQKDDPRRTDLLYTIVKILFKDRLKLYESNPNGIQPHLCLNTHVDEQSAQKYGGIVVDFLNSIIQDNHGNGLFSYEQLNTKSKTLRGSHLCKLNLDYELLGRLAIRNNPRLLSITVEYP